MRKFLLPSLIAAGFISSTETKAINNPNSYLFLDNEIEEIIQNSFLRFELAGHSSHSSHGSHRSGQSSGHASHSSHGSHRSSSGGGGTYSPAPPGNSTTPESILPKPKIDPDSSEYNSLVIEVQACLYALNRYRGAIDGIIGPKTSAAISKAQKDLGVPITGQLDEKVINACRNTLNK